MSLVGDIKDVGAAPWAHGKAAKDSTSGADQLAKTPILRGGQVTIAGMKLTTGCGDPDSGKRFGQGASRFTQAGATLGMAYPNGTWSGSGSEAYANVNSRQVGQTEAMAGADRSVNAVLTREARQITATRDSLDDQSDWLVDVGLVTFLVAAIPHVGRGAALAMEIAAVTKALETSTSELTELTRQVNDNAAEIAQTAGQYSDASDVPNLPKTDPNPDTPPPSRDDEDDEPGDAGESDDPTDDAPTAPGAGRPGAGSGSGGSSPAEGAPSVPPVPASPSPPTSPASTGSAGNAGLGAPAPPMGALPAAASAPPAAATGGVSAAQIADLVKSMVQTAMEQKAKDEEAGKDDATKDTDGDGIPDLAEDENGDGIPDAEQDADGDGEPDGPMGAAAGISDAGRAPIHADGLEGPTSPFAVTLNGNGRIGSPAAAQQ